MSRISLNTRLHGCTHSPRRSNVLNFESQMIVRMRVSDYLDLVETTTGCDGSMRAEVTRILAEADIPADAPMHTVIYKALRRIKDTDDQDTCLYDLIIQPFLALREKNARN